MLVHDNILCTLVFCQCCPVARPDGHTICNLIDDIFLVFRLRNSRRQPFPLVTSNLYRRTRSLVTTVYNTVYN